MATSAAIDVRDTSTPPDTTGEAAVPQKPSVFRRAVPTLTFLARRILSSLLVLLGATFIVYMLLSYSVDPLEDLRTSTAPNRDALMAARIQMLDLNTPAPLRYLHWLRDVLTGNLGTSWRTGQSVSAMLSSAIPSTVTLVMGAIFIAIGLGILVGIVSALRQYTRFDYGVTFMSFVLFSLPSFWVAVLLKLWGAIGFNNFLRDPQFTWPTIVIVALIFGALWSAVIGGTRNMRWIIFGAATAATALGMYLISVTDWILNPGLGIVGITVLGAIVAFGLTALTAGLDNRRALYSALSAVVVGAILYFPLQAMLGRATWLMIFLLALVAAIVGCVIGWFFGGPDRMVSMRGAAITAVAVGVFVFIDRVMQVWQQYNAMSQINNRPISTMGAQTPGLQGDFWVTTLDQFTHLILPTVTLILISFAAYTRYTRSSMLEVMNQDYIRTARAKGLPERVVTVRHAFRNALIPLATIIPLDIAAMFGGAIITERIFSWSGMGSMFIQALNTQDAAPIMGYFLVTGTLLVIASILVDVIYAALDPRIRVDS
ncbi:MAG: ABC transporter permease subunit [Cellulomonadaceae bacterium]|jgi:peptide/nickel transport system permease protein|nr:ABC transporter permease subunit [Cellulomonadaceae bacterium]